MAKFGLKVNYAGVRVDQRTAAVHRAAGRLRGLRAAVPGGRAEAQHAPVRLPADRRRRHVAHVQPRDRRAPRQQPAPGRGDDDRHLHRQHHAVERPARSSSSTRSSRATTTQIVPVVRSDGSGTSWQLSSYMRYMEHGMWAAFCAQVHIPDAPVQFWPNFGASVGQQGSDGVANYVANPATGPGSIGYVEYGYALARRFPVSYVTQPQRRTSCTRRRSNDATALRHATFNSDNTQNLTGVYTVPRGQLLPDLELQLHDRPDQHGRPFTAEKGAVLGKFILYFACAGQKSAASSSATRRCRRTWCRTTSAWSRRSRARRAPPALKNCDNPTITGQAKGDDPAPPGGSTQNQNPPAAHRQPARARVDDQGNGAQDHRRPAWTATLPSPIGIALSADELARPAGRRQAGGRRRPRRDDGRRSGSSPSTSRC